MNLVNTPLLAQSGCSATALAALLAAQAKRGNFALADVKGCLGADPLGELAADGSLPVSLDRAYDEMATLLRWAKTHAPKLQVIGVSDQAYDDGGASALGGLAFTLATAVEYLRAMTARGLSVDEVAPRLRLSLSLGPNFFMEIAKLRAARRLWARVVESCGGSEESQKATIHCRTSAWNRSTYDAHVNLLRSTSEAFAGVVGGCDSMHVGFFDDAVRQPDEFSRRIARNTQLILRHESHFDKIVDPAGGSWYIESLTDRLAHEAWALFQEMERQGGMFRSLQDGFPQEQLAGTVEERLAAVRSRKDVFVGTNKYPNDAERPLEPRPIDYAALHKQRSEEIAAVKTTAGHSQVTDMLEVLKGTPQSRGGVMEVLIDAASQGATLGEITAALRCCDGESPKVTPVVRQRGPAVFEMIRQAVALHKAKTGESPRAFLAAVGSFAKLKPRMDFSTEFFHVVGFEVDNGKSFETAEQAVGEAAQSGAKVIVICATDDDYPELVPKMTPMAKQAVDDAIVVLAGYPRDHIDAFTRAGVDEFIHVRANTADILTNLLKGLGVLS